MKLSFFSSLVLFLLLTSPLFGQFDGHNGQSSFHSEVEEENRPSFLRIEEETLLIERWQSALNTLGLENVSTYEEIDLEEMQSVVQREWNQFYLANQKLYGYIDQLEIRNEQLRSLRLGLAQVMLELQSENEHFTAMGESLTESESEILEENKAEIRALARELDNYEAELTRNEYALVDQVSALMDNEMQLRGINEEKEALQVFAFVRTQGYQWMQYAHAK